MSRARGVLAKALMQLALLIMLLPVANLTEAAGPPRPPMIVYGEVLNNGISPDSALLMVKVGNEERQVEVTKAPTGLALYRLEVAIDDTTATSKPKIQFQRLDEKTLALSQIDVEEGRVVRQDILVDQPGTIAQRISLSKVSATHDEQGWHLLATLDSYPAQGSFKGMVRWYYHVNQDPATVDPDDPTPMIKPLGEKSLEALDAEQETELIVSETLEDLAYFLVVATPLLGEKHGPSKVHEIMPEILDPSDI